MELRLNALGLQFEFVYGIKGNQLTPNEIDDGYDDNKAKRYLGRSMTKGEIGCALSHKLIYKRMIHEKIKRAIILEMIS
jgi:glycosyl transferase family 25